MNCVQRSKRTWEGLPEKYLQIHNDLENLMDHHHNYSNYRKELASRTGVILPYLGIILRDISITELATSTINEDSTINFERIIVLGTILKNFQTYQKSLKCVLETPCPITQRTSSVPSSPNLSGSGGSRSSTSTGTSFDDLSSANYEDQLRKLSFICEPPSLASVLREEN